MAGQYPWYSSENRGGPTLTSLGWCKLTNTSITAIKTSFVLLFSGFCSPMNIQDHSWLVKFSQFCLGKGLSLYFPLILTAVLAGGYGSDGATDWTENKGTPPSYPSHSPSVSPSPDIVNTSPPLRLISPQSIPSSVGWDERLRGWLGQPGDRQVLLTAIQNSIHYLSTPHALEAYQRYEKGVGASLVQSTPLNRCDETLLERVKRSLNRFRQLLVGFNSPHGLQSAVRREFIFYQSIGKDGQGQVGFTGYFQPVYAASRTATDVYRYPLFRTPPDIHQWTKPHPTRGELEGRDGLQSHQGMLKGLELVWLRDRLEAFLVHVQGSAQLRLTDQTIMTVGYAGRTDYPYTSIGKELIKDGKVPSKGLTLPAVLAYLQKHPKEVDEYLTRNQRMVFFRETFGSPATGSLRVPVTPERSIATDKSIFPPGALAWFQTSISYPPHSNHPSPGLINLKQRSVGRFALDQDTGGAIIGAGRVDIFMGTGELAGQQAGLINTPGKLYYLLLPTCPWNKRLSKP